MKFFHLFDFFFSTKHFVTLDKCNKLGQLLHLGCYRLDLLLSVQSNCFLLLNFESTHNSCKLNKQTFSFMTFYCIFLITFFKLFESIYNCKNGCKYRDRKVDLACNTSSLVICSELSCPCCCWCPLSSFLLPLSHWCLLGG